MYWYKSFNPIPMRTCFYSFLSYILCIIYFSCGDLDKQSKDLAQETIEINGQTYTLKKNVTVTNAVKSIKPNKPEIIFHELRDEQRNMAMAYLPLPDNWKIKDQVDTDGVVAIAPNNIKVYGERSNNFVFSQLPGFNQMILNQGEQVKPLKNINQLIKEDFTPLFEKDGFKLIKQYALPNQKAYDENYEQFVFKPVPMQKTFEVMAAEWEHTNGTMSLVVIRQYISYTQEACYWGYRVSGIEAPKAHFESAKTNYLYTLANTKFNPQWLQTCYMEDAQTSARMNRIHEDRMMQLRAEGQAIIERGKAHSAMVDNNHKKWMDAHLERENIANPTNGQTYQVDAGSKEYWMNSSNEYISSNNVLYDPNMDKAVNTELWTKMTINN
ncbi:hypothetical protein A9200_17315 [Maribacter hydrothermalis]|uniref:Uncharacterized protein n=2 Tax=Maribacter hydrothermalis TaxID=1836467 RepID=A0A1B7Z9J2_9FLAO|nr:hypothetical protein BTR34_05010 [Maribacter hydrothermalis]OBR39365.1 hypothetical protein A9200_17315 [Maribacter hydrothermalis]